MLDEIIVGSVIVVAAIIVLTLRVVLRRRELAKQADDSVDEEADPELVAEPVAEPVVPPVAVEHQPAVAAEEAQGLGWRKASDLLKGRDKPTR